MQGTFEGKVFIQIEEKGFFAGAEARFVEFVLEGGDPVRMIQQISFIVEPSDSGDRTDCICGRDFGGGWAVRESRNDDGNGGSGAIPKSDGRQFDGLSGDECRCELKEDECGAEEQDIEPRGECNDGRKEAAREAEAGRKAACAEAGEGRFRALAGGKIREEGIRSGFGFVRRNFGRA